MDNTFKISIEVSFSDTAAALIGKLADTLAAGIAVAANPHLLAETKLSEEAPAAEADPAPAEAPLDMPEEIADPMLAPAPAPKEITDADLREAVMAVKTAGNAAKAKELFKEFGIASSRDCPQDKRAELLNRLNALGNA